MKVLLDTNIIIHREASTAVKPDIGTLFNWLDRLHHEKIIHPLTIEEIRKHKDSRVVSTFEIKLKNYQVLNTQSPENPQIQALRVKYDKTENDANDTSLLKEVFNNRVDIFISEDRRIHDKAAELGIAVRVFTIDEFLEKVVAENPNLVDYRVLSVKKEFFGRIEIGDPFFESFKQDYVGFEAWFNRKSEEIAYICKGENEDILAFLYVKPEPINSETYNDIEPRFEAKRRLKIGTFKVSMNGYKLGERFLKIIFDNALNYEVEEIYVTLFERTDEQKRLIHLLEDWGFQRHGVKNTSSGEELVYVRNFTPRIDISNPNLSYPYFSRRARKFIVPIYPAYHTELFPDSILRTESPADFIENRPNRNAINKVYISRSRERSLRVGDVIVFYRTAAKNQSAYYSSVVTTVGIVQSVITNIPDAETFIELCRRRSVFSDEELRGHWDYYPNLHPFIVNFLYVLSFTEGNRLNRKALLDLNIISNEPPRGFVRLSDTAFQSLMEHSHADQRVIVD
jgi:predicted nucleic acid-binding protein